MYLFVYLIFILLVSGSNGADMQEWVRLMEKNFSFPHINVLYPTAPLQPYTPAGGMMSNVWFDRADITPDAPEKLDSLASIEKEVKNLIKKEHLNGIESKRIVVGKILLTKRLVIVLPINIAFILSMSGTALHELELCILYFCTLLEVQTVVVYD